MKVIEKPAMYVRAPGEKVQVNGYFCSERKHLVVATGKPHTDWLHVFIHESCHMDQYIADPYRWEKWMVGYTLFFQWLGKEIELPKKTLLLTLNDILECEKDCEMRTVQKIKRYKLDINVEEYIQKSNAYLYFYRYMLTCRYWMKGVYGRQDVWSLAPKEFKPTYRQIPRELRKQFTKLRAGQ